MMLLVCVRTVTRDRPYMATVRMPKMLSSR